MVRRTKPKEVILAGEAADTTARLKPTAPEPGGGKATIFEPTKSGGYGDAKAGGAIDPDAAAEPDPAKAGPRTLAELEAELKMPVTSKAKAPPPATAAPTPPPAAAEAPLSAPPSQPTSTAPAPTRAPVPPSPAKAPPPAPGKAAPKTAKAPLRSPKEQSQAMAETVVAGFVDRLKTEADAKGGYLSAADLDTMQSEFSAQTKALTEVFEQSFDAFSDAQRKAEWDKKRELPFNRIVVKKVSHLFGETERQGFDTIRRRMLPGFFAALGMMLGPDAIEEFQESCRLIVGRIREERGPTFDWDDVYTSPEANAIVLDVQVAVAAHFEDLERRSDWFIELVNGSLAPITDVNRDEAGWELTPAGFRRFLTAFLADLKELLETDLGKLQITKRHGADTCDAVFRILKKLDG